MLRLALVVAFALISVLASAAPSMAQSDGVWFVVTPDADPFQFRPVCGGSRATALETAAALRAVTEGGEGIHALPPRAYSAQVEAGLIRTDFLIPLCQDGK